MSIFYLSGFQWHIGNWCRSTSPNHSLIRTMDRKAMFYSVINRLCQIRFSPACREAWAGSDGHQNHCWWIDRATMMSKRTMIIADLSENGLSGFRNDIDLRKLHGGPLRTPTSVRFDSKLWMSLITRNEALGSKKSFIHKLDPEIAFMGEFHCHWCFFYCTWTSDKNHRHSS